MRSFKWSFPVGGQEARVRRVKKWQLNEDQGKVEHLVEPLGASYLMPNGLVIILVCKFP